MKKKLKYIGQENAQQKNYEWHSKKIFQIFNLLLEKSLFHQCDIREDKTRAGACDKNLKNPSIF